MQLDPFHRTLLYHDGSMTRFLELWYDKQVKVQVISEKTIKIDNAEKLQREVILYNEDGKLLFARSLWELHKYEYYMKDKSLPIGIQLIQQKIGQFREILKVDIAEDKEYTYYRIYNIYCDGELLTQIEEYFYI